MQLYKVTNWFLTKLNLNSISFNFARVAQPVERLAVNQKVRGSIPRVSDFLFFTF